MTGGAGYIGRSLLSALTDAGFDVRVLEDFSGSSPRAFIGTPEFDFVRGDVRDPAGLKAAMDGIDTVIHLAAVTGAEASHDIPDHVFDVNLGGTETVLEAAEATGVERVVLASSCNVYGLSAAEHLVETDDPNPVNPYAESKLAAEDAAQRSSVETVALRLATNFGWNPAIRFNLVVNLFVFRALHGEPLTVHGDGSNWRPYMHVSDSARAFVEALDWDEGIYNVGLENVPIAEVAETVADVVPASVDIEYQYDRDPGPSYHVDFGKAASQGFVAEMGFEAGIEDLVRRFRDRPVERVTHV